MGNLSKRVSRRTLLTIRKEPAGTALFVALLALAIVLFASPFSGETPIALADAGE